MTVSGPMPNEQAHKTGIILINIGTPVAPNQRAVKQYLKRFLDDPHVIPGPAWRRKLLVHGLIIPLRVKRSTQQYQTIWTPRGSPLWAHSRALVSALQTQLGTNYKVAYAGCFSPPELSEALASVSAAGCQTWQVLPLFPQYAVASTELALDCFKAALATHTTPPKTIHTHTPFFHHPGFINSWAHIIDRHCQEHQPEHVLFSYHGLPKAAVQASHCDQRPACADQHTCPSVADWNARCYRAQCFATSAALTAACQHLPPQTTTCFQSRVGRNAWIGPDTEVVLRQLAEQGIKRLAVACPAFVCDCLETLYEIQIEGAEVWQACGGEHLTLIPSLNHNPQWIDTLAHMITDTERANHVTTECHP